MRLLALDPGKSTGFAFASIFDSQGLTLLSHGQISGGLDGFIAGWERIGGNSADIVIAEGFRLDGRTPNPDTTTLEILGALRVLRPDFITQMNTAKVHAPDSALKRWGLWLPGEQHARDAVRHLIAYVKLNHHMPSIEMFWPPREEKS